MHAPLEIRPSKFAFCLLVVVLAGMAVAQSR
jgi:hypothetical protein